MYDWKPSLSHCQRYSNINQQLGHGQHHVSAMWKPWSLSGLQYRNRTSLQRYTTYFTWMHLRPHSPAVVRRHMLCCTSPQSRPPALPCRPPTGQLCSLPGSTDTHQQHVLFSLFSKSKCCLDISAVWTVHVAMGQQGQQAVTMLGGGLCIQFSEGFHYCTACWISSHQGITKPCADCACEGSACGL